MKTFVPLLTATLLLCTSSAAWAQSTPSTTQQSPTRPAEDGSVNPFVFGYDDQLIGPGAAPFMLMQINPLTLPQGGQLSEDAQRKLVGAFLVGISVPMFVYGLQKVNSQAKWVAGRNLTARDAGAALFGGALNAGQGALLLMTDGPEAKRRAHIKLDPENYRDPLIPLLHQDAMDARKSRQTTGVLIGVGGALAGAVVAFLPVSDTAVDRRVLIAAGLATMAAGAGVGIYTYNSDPPEVGLFKDALERQSMTERFERKKKSR